MLVNHDLYIIKKPFSTPLGTRGHRATPVEQNDPVAHLTEVVFVRSIPTPTFIRPVPRRALGRALSFALHPPRPVRPGGRGTEAAPGLRVAWLPGAVAAEERRRRTEWGHAAVAAHSAEGPDLGSLGGGKESTKKRWPTGFRLHLQIAVGPCRSPGHMNLGVNLKPVALLHVLSCLTLFYCHTPTNCQITTQNQSKSRIE